MPCRWSVGMQDKGCGQSYYIVLAVVLRGVEPVVYAVCGIFELDVVRPVVRPVALHGTISGHSGVFSCGAAQESLVDCTADDRADSVVRVLVTGLAYWTDPARKSRVCLFCRILA